MRRLLGVMTHDLKHHLRRPLFWILVIIVLFSAWGFSTGKMRIQSGDSQVGGEKAVITSEFALSQQLSLLVFLFYSFFVAVAAGMAVIRDDELKVSELIHVTGLRPVEYLGGKLLAVMIAFLIVLGLHLVFAAFFNHVVPNAEADANHLRGSFQLLSYLKPAITFGVPTILFFAGASFAVGIWFRKPILVFVLPVAAVMFCGFFVWSWSPTWLDPRINKAIGLADPSGYRWIFETWLKVDRGVRFYNDSPVPLEVGFVMSRLAFVLLGVGSVLLTIGPFVASLRGRRPVRARAPSLAGSEAAQAPPTTAAVSAVRVVPPRLWRSILDVARFELRELRHQPGLYLFIPLIVLETIGTGLIDVGVFQTPLLATSGTLAVKSMNVLTFLVTMLLMFYTVESLERERTTGLAPIYYATPVRTLAFLIGKAIANSVVGLVILFATLVSCIVVLLIQGTVAIRLGPFLITWGLLLVPTFLVWTAFVTTAHAIVKNRYTTYAVCLAVLIFSLYRQLTNHMNWAGNWMLWSALKWSDMGVFELDRTALVLNRLLALSLAVLFSVLTIKLYARRERDALRLWNRLRPAPLLRQLLRVGPFLIVPAVLLIILVSRVNHGFEGRAAKDRHLDYWKKNLATFKDAEVPTISDVDVSLEIEPSRRWFKASGTYELLNRHDHPLREIPITVGDHFENLEWKLDGESCKPEERAKLFLFAPPAGLAPGAKMKIGFAYEGTFPKGVSENGGGASEFILPGGVVLTSFDPSFVPVVGYLERVGTSEEDHNNYEPRVYPDDFYEGITESAFGSSTPYPVRVQITGPADYTFNSVGVLDSESVENGKRTVVWKSDHPVSFFNVVGARWSVWRGEGTAIFYDPDHHFNIDAMGKALDAARRYYSEWFYPFPWRELKLSEFPALATYAQGFPTDITFSESIGFLTRSSPKANTVFLVTAHESAHQWWGNILVPGKGPGGSILSEGMAHFSTILLSEQVLGLQGRIETCKRLEESYGRDRQVNSERPLTKMDGSRAGDTTVTYDKGGWVLWMLHSLMGREANLSALRSFIARYHDDPDHPVLQDFIAHVRPFAPDPGAFDAFVKQWFFAVVVPEYELTEGKRERVEDRWRVTVNVANIGEGRMPIEVAATRADRFVVQDDAAAAHGPAEVSPDYREARTTIELGAGEKQTVTLDCDFEPERVIVDPDAKVLQLRRANAIVRF
jgi:hypothetical protein